MPLESLKKVPREHAPGIPYQFAPLAFMFATAVLTFAFWKFCCDSSSKYPETYIALAEQE